jgi:hypothetical protein
MSAEARGTPDATSEAARPAPALASDWVAVAGLVAALFACAFIRVQDIDVPWHLATARLAQTLGHWPRVNTFSYTFPDYPLYQQYPLYQKALWSLYGVLGWDGLVLLTGLGWTLVLLLFVRWGGPWRAGVTLNLPWAFALFALQRRMILRPDLFTMIAFGAMLLCYEAYRRGRRGAIAFVPFVHLLWVNSHQLFPVSLGTQALFVAHVWLSRRGRWGVDTADAAVPLAPPIYALATSVALCFATPLGLEVLNVTRHTMVSVATMRDQVSEFTRVWRSPLELRLAILTGAPALWAFWRGRRRWAPFDVGLWLMSLALMLTAMRGLMFFGVVSIAAFERALLRRQPGDPPFLPAVRPALVIALRVLAGAVSLLLAGNAIAHRWVWPALVLDGTQSGFGRSLGGWADAATEFVRRSPPPGHMLNMPWTTGNALLWGAPEQPVFVDPRFESYPNPFLRAAADAYSDDAKLEALIEQHHVGWIFAEHQGTAVRARLVALVRAGWAPVYVDSGHLILVRPGPDGAAYVSARRIDLARAEPADLIAGAGTRAFLRAQQRARFAALMRDLGFAGRADEQRALGLAEAGPDARALFER